MVITHRIGDLENLWDTWDNQRTITHRIGDLEIKII